ncbi:MAG: hypothetical protein IKT08_08525 [Bacteroidales bacterium]|nr:hypothetical protein [Bacteroidales bacterium]
MKTKVDAIIGAIAGDIIGSPYEFKDVEPEDFRLFDKHCSYTDDTVLTIAVALLENSQKTGRKWNTMFQVYLQMKGCFMQKTTRKPFNTNLL